MSLTKDFFERPTNITAKVICDSISEAGIRLTTLELEYPRFIHSEMMTHRGLSKNSSSSRAIPIQKMIDLIEANTAVPLYWGKNKSGMQAGEEINGFDLEVVQDLWGSAKSNAISSADVISQVGLHKQTANRLLEPFQMMKVVVTGTDWENFFNLRIHPDAQPEICMLAYQMYKAMQESNPKLLRQGEWHLPYVEIMQDQYDIDATYYYTWNIDDSGTETDGYMYENRLTLEEAQRISASCTAQTSFRKSDDSLEKADDIFQKLSGADVLHASPFEHLATPVAKSKEVLDQYEMYPVVLTEDSVNLKHLPETWQEGVTHMNKQGQLCSGNLRGWVQYRHLLPNNTAWSFDFEGRMKLFDEVKQT